MKVRLELAFDNCEDCPYSEWKYPSCGPDHLFCNNKYAEIISEWAWNGRTNKNRLNKQFKKIPIPDWCPLRKPKKRVEGVTILNCPKCRRRLEHTPRKFLDARRHKCHHCGKTWDIRDRTEHDKLDGYPDMEDVE